MVILYLLLRPHWWLLGILTGINLWILSLTFGFRGEAALSGGELQVLSYNVRVFNAYPHLEAEKPGSSAAMLKWVQEHPAPIKCLQEFYHADRQDSIYEFKTLDTLKQFLTANNYHAHYTTTRENNNHFGIITFSKYPIINKGFVDFGMQSDNVCIFTDINYQDTNLRIFNSHFGLYDAIFTRQKQ